nr:unnamed protein product [Callosobruchus analis]
MTNFGRSTSRIVTIIMRVTYGHPLVVKRWVITLTFI